MLAQTGEEGEETKTGVDRDFAKEEGTEERAGGGKEVEGRKRTVEVKEEGENIENDMDMSTAFGGCGFFVKRGDFRTF